MHGCSFKNEERGIKDRFRLYRKNSVTHDSPLYYFPEFVSFQKAVDRLDKLLYLSKKGHNLG